MLLFLFWYFQAVKVIAFSARIDSWFYTVAQAWLDKYLNQVDKHTDIYKEKLGINMLRCAYGL